MMKAMRKPRAVSQHPPARGRNAAAKTLARRRSHMRNPQSLQCAVNHRLQFMGILPFTPLGENGARFFCIEPGGIPAVFLRLAGLANLHQKSFDHMFLHPARLPKNSLGMHVDMKMPWLDDAKCARLFFGFAFCGLTVRETRLGGSLRKGPLASAVGVH